MAKPTTTPPAAPAAKPKLPAKELWTCVFRREGRPDWPMTVRIRWLLKHALRSLGLRCVSCVCNNATEVQADAQAQDQEKETQ
jgi:hypothetical protein